MRKFSEEISSQKAEFMYFVLHMICFFTLKRGDMKYSFWTQGRFKYNPLPFY